MKVSEIPKESIKGYEARHATYAKSSVGKDDLLVIKEYVHLTDGTRVPNIRMIKNYKREFWVTKEGFRKHKDKLEWDDEKHLQKYTTTQANLNDAIARALGKPGVKSSLRQLARSPYLYGCDIGTGPLIKKQYAERYPDCIGPKSTVAIMDIETDVIMGTEEVLMVTLSFGSKVYTSINKTFLGTTVNPLEKVQQKFDEYLGEYKESRKINLEVEVFDTPGQCVYAAIQKGHEWMPDFIGFWNMNFDLPKMIKELERERYSLADVFSDPSVPQEFRFFKYTEGNSQKVTQGGKIMALHPADRWHEAECPASFYFIDAMCLYKRLRTAKGNEPSYSLDYTLQKNLGLRKLKFDAVQGVGGLEWHQVMQRDFKIEYVIYNIFDCIGVELLDEKTGDMAYQFAILCEFSDFGDFTSNPRRIADDMHFLCREKGWVAATTSSDMVDENDKNVVDMTGWIVTLAAHMVADCGIIAISDLDRIHSLIFAHLAD